jgi:hypothetical protein
VGAGKDGCVVVAVGSREHQARGTWGATRSRPPPSATEPGSSARPTTRPRPTRGSRPPRPRAIGKARSPARRARSGPGAGR